MAIAHNSNEYTVDTFLDLQKDLANYLNEAHDIDGEWTVDEKKRMINRGFVAMATQTLFLQRNIQWVVTGTAANPISTLTVPDMMIKPMRLFINGSEYLEMELENFLHRLGNFVDIPQGSQLSSSTNITQLDQLNRFFYWNRGSNTFDINPPISDSQNVMLYAIVMPKKLEKDDEISDFHPSFHHLAPIWAATKMLPRDEEHRDRGEWARRQWDEGIKDLERFKHRSSSNKAVRFKKDPEKFSKRNSLSGDGDVDWGTTFDRYP